MRQSLLTIPLQQLELVLAEGWSALRRSSRYRDVPPLAPSFGLIGETLLDRSFTLATSAFVGVPAPEQVRSAVADVQAGCELFAERGWLEDPASYHRDPPALSPEPAEARTTWSARGLHRYQHVRFTSGFAPHEGEPGRDRFLGHPCNGTGHVYLLEHEEPAPWLVCVHGFAMGTPLVNFTGFPVDRLHRDLGLNLAFPVLPLHGPRGTRRFSGGEVLDTDYMRMVHLFAQAAFDVRGVIRWLREREASRSKGAVQAPRIGLYGISLGGYVASLVATLEEGLECVIAGIPAVDFPNLARDNEPWVLRRYDDDLKIDWKLVRTISHPVSPLALEPKIPKSGRFIYAGLADRIVKPDQPRALWRHWGQPEIHWFSGGHVLGIANRSIGPFLSRSLEKVGLASA